MLDINLPGEDGLLLTMSYAPAARWGSSLVTGRSDAVDLDSGPRDGSRRLCHQAVRAKRTAGAGQEPAVAHLWQPPSRVSRRWPTMRCALRPLALRHPPSPAQP